MARNRKEEYKIIWLGSRNSIGKKGGREEKNKLIHEISLYYVSQLSANIKIFLRYILTPNAVFLAI